MSDYDALQNCIIDIFWQRKSLNIADGIVAMEGKVLQQGGQASGVIMGSGDAFDLDTVAAEIIGANLIIYLF